LKRKEVPREEDEAQEAERKRLRPAHFNYVKNVVMEDDIAARLAEKAGRKIEATRRASEWMSRGEVRQFASLLDMPICTVRIHKQARKKMQPPPSRKKRGRITIMLGERDSQAMVTYEDAQAVARGPRRHTGIKWRGMTLFTKQAKPPEQTDTQAYIQVGDAMYAMPFEDTKLWQAFVEREEETRVASEALLLKMKANGKELDPRHFNQEEASAFRKSDQAEWRSWGDNHVLKRLSAGEAAKDPKHLVFKALLRIVRVSKAKPGDPLKPKSRLVVRDI